MKQIGIFFVALSFLVLLAQVSLAKDTGLIEPPGGSFNMEITVFDEANLSIGKTAHVDFSVANFAPDEKRLFFIWWKDEQESSTGFYRVTLPSWGALHMNEQYPLQKAGKHRVTLSVCINPPFNGNCAYVGETSIEFNVSNTYAVQTDVAVEYTPIPEGYDNQSEGFIRSMQWHPLVEDMNLSVGEKKIPLDENVSSGETVNFRFTIKTREVR